MENDVLLEADHIQMTYPGKGGGLHVLEDISIDGTVTDERRVFISL